MLRKMLPILLLCAGPALSGPALAQPSIVPPAPVSRADTAAIAASIRRQLQACWSLPAGFEGQRLAVTLVFLGDGTLLQEPQVAPGGSKSAAKRAPLIQSAIRAIRRCAPFTGLEALGAHERQRFSIEVDFAA